MNKKMFCSSLIIIISLFSQNHAQPKGKLLIVGGMQSDEIVQKFVEISGGAESRIMIIPNASSEPKRSSELQHEEFAKYGGNSDYVLFDRETVDNQENLDKMEWANAVFFLGGDQSDLTKDMLGTKLLQKVFDIYNSGGVVGGSSAGAAVMSKIMITGNELVNKDSTRYYVTIEKNNIETVEGFGFLNTVIIDQHFLMRKRLNRLISVVLENPDKLGVGIDESTGIIVYPNNTFEVIGQSLVLVFDATKSSKITTNDSNYLAADNIQLSILKKGDKYNIMEKCIVE